MQELSAAGRLAAWGTAALAGDVSPDEAALAVTGRDDPGHRVAGLPGEDGAVTLAYALGKLRALGTTGLRLVLPRPGDVSGLPGPPPFNQVALAAGAAVVTTGEAGIGLVPDGRATWAAHQVTADRRTHLDLQTAERQLGTAIREAAGALAQLEVARWDPAAAEVLAGRSAARRPVLPPSSPPDAHRLLAQALRITAVVEVARAGEGAAVSASSMRARREALRDLDEAARRAVEAACSAAAH